MGARPVDYEAAWEELQELILQRDGWGTRALVTEMANLRVKHTIREDPSSAGGATTATDRRDERPATDRSEEDHDGSHRNARSAVLAC